MAKLAVIESPEISRPRIVTALGKQRSGKSLYLRYLIERGAKERQRPLKMVDADPHNSTLRQHYADADSPESSGLEDRRMSLEQSIRDQVKSAADGNAYDAVWDIGGGDLLLPKMARDVRFTETLERIGIELITFYMISPNLSDLEYFQTLEDADFHPRNLALVLNAGLIQGDRQPARAFDALISAPLVDKLVKRGAKMLFMPALKSDCVEAIEATKSQTIREAIPKLDFIHEMYATTWLDKDMEEFIARPLMEWGWM